MAKNRLLTYFQKRLTAIAVVISCDIRKEPYPPIFIFRMLKKREH